LKAGEFPKLSTGKFFTRFALGIQGEKIGKGLAKGLTGRELRELANSARNAS
jgi:hypothetical protein